MEKLVIQAGTWIFVLLLAIMGFAMAADVGFAAHMAIIAFAAAIGVWITISKADYGAIAKGIIHAPVNPSRYDDEVIRWGVIAVMVWAVVGMLAGLYIASELVDPQLNLPPYLNFGRLRPVHTSGVIFAFGGNALIATSFYVVQRTCRARLAFPWLAR
ncbi:MAG: cbb3-type cytochrome c oxidase subunit I, partial [Alphaproteobacteria bacterium]|nr:cbb3-type cytochrome c oxidase subunit I [Alphaproteobacteria bacterium]